jgi:hypothetical protein
MGTTRAASYFLGLVLLVAAAVALGQQMSTEQPGEWLAPCVLGGGGILLLGIGVFLPVSVPTESQCDGESDGEDGSPSVDGGTD